MLPWIPYTAALCAAAAFALLTRRSGKRGAAPETISHNKAASMLSLMEAAAAAYEAARQEKMPIAWVIENARRPADPSCRLVCPKHCGRGFDI